MRVSKPTSPTLLLRPLTACPRCDGRSIVALAEHAESSFAWYECGECAHLWAIPRGWTPHPEPLPMHSRDRE